MLMSWVYNSQKVQQTQTFDLEREIFLNGRFSKNLISSSIGISRKSNDYNCEHISKKTQKSQALECLDPYRQVIGKN